MKTLERIAKRHAGLVRHVGRQYRLSDADLDELNQEVLIRVWRATERGGEVPVSYVHRASTSAAIDLLRRRRARGADRTVPLDQIDEPMSPADPALAVEEAETAAEVDRAIEAIPASRRPAVRMYLAGHGCDEVAAATGWTRAKARNLLYRGLADLRQELQGAAVSTPSSSSAALASSASWADSPSRRVASVASPRPRAACAASS